MRPFARDAFSTASTGVSAASPPSSKLACSDATRDAHVDDQRQRALCASAARGFRALGTVGRDEGDAVCMFACVSELSPLQRRRGRQ